MEGLEKTVHGFQPSTIFERFILHIWHGSEYASDNEIFDHVEMIMNDRKRKNIDKKWTFSHAAFPQQKSTRNKLFSKGFYS